jgi:hypothetical protein
MAQIKNLWIEAGGNPTAASMAAAIAMAESSGNPDAQNDNGDGSKDRGLWQINSVHGSQSTFDPLANAKAAVAISQNGTSWRAWCTAWSNGLCGGTYLGQGAPYLKYLSGGVGTTPVVGVPTATETSASLLDPQSWADAFLKPVGMWFFYGGMTVLGALLIWWGLWLMFFQTATGKTVISLVTSKAKVAKKAKQASSGSEKASEKVES